MDNKTGRSNKKTNYLPLLKLGLSRGRGIKCFNNLVEIQDHIKSKDSQWVIQKYIERPLIIHKRKFDIRQWVLVSSWNPLTVWIYDECYVRFTAQSYDSDDIENRYLNIIYFVTKQIKRIAHLTNNQIQKHVQDQSESNIIEDNMWFEEDLIQYLEEELNEQNIFEESIKPKIVEIVNWSLESCQDAIETRKSSFEMFGYDFMIDEKFGVWLLEINSSPSMEYSTHVTTKLVKECSESIVKLIADTNMGKKKGDTGKFVNIKNGIYVNEKHMNVGLNLCVEGKQIKK